MSLLRIDKLMAEYEELFVGKPGHIKVKSREDYIIYLLAEIAKSLVILESK